MNHCLWKKERARRGHVYAGDGRALRVLLAPDLGAEERTPAEHGTRASLYANTTLRHTHGTRLRWACGLTCGAWNTRRAGRGHTAAAVARKRGIGIAGKGDRSSRTRIQFRPPS